MGALHRAVLYLRRKPGKAVILAAVMAVACGMALLSLGILETTRTLSTGLKQAAVPVAAVYAADGRGIVGEELAAQLAELPSVKGANRLRAVDATPANFANIEGTLADPGFDDAVRLNAFDDLASDSPFSDQLVRLVEGALVTSEDEHAAVVHVDLAEANGLGLGDRVAFAGENGERAEARIVGLYAAAGGNESGAGGVTARDQSFNQIYVDNVTAADLGAQGFTEVRLTLADADRADDAIADIQRTCGNGFATEIYDSTLSQLAPSLDQTSAAAQATLALVALTGTAAATMLRRCCSPSGPFAGARAGGAAFARQDQGRSRMPVARGINAPVRCRGRRGDRRGPAALPRHRRRARAACRPAGSRNGGRSCDLRRFDERRGPRATRPSSHSRASPWSQRPPARAPPSH
ncbi:hypothetical protein [Eggerthella sinensis]|uniref:hypothetical protein n=1 Tax=Eggerthella sinensis TaxID=242230 RepID=UPI0022E011BC|nr:hypothetical protein [Eggerthella sinensis]